MSRLIASTVLVAIAIIIIEVRRLGVGKELLVSALRSFVQLMVVGYVIQFVFDLDKLQYQVLLLLAMTTVASFTARGRAKGVRGAFALSFISILALILSNASTPSTPGVTGFGSSSDSSAFRVRSVKTAA